MNNILVAVDDTGSNAHVMEAAIARAEREGSTLVVLHAMSDREYDSRHRRVAAVRDLTHDGFTYGITQAREEARAVADRAAVEAIGSRPVPFEGVGAVGSLAATVCATAEQYGCSTVMLARERSWPRRLLGRTDRKIAKGFDGPVLRVPPSARRRSADDAALLEEADAVVEEL